MDEPRPRVPRELFLFLVICTLGAALFRWHALPSGLPYISYIDEGHVLHRVQHMLSHKTWDPAWYRYPSFLINVIAVVCSSFELLLGISIRSSIPAGYTEYYDLIGPQEMILIGRTVVFLSSLVLIPLASYTAFLLSGTRAAGYAALISAALPAITTRSTIVIVDTVAGCLVALAFLFSALSLRKNNSLSLLCLASFAAGCAFTTKYPAGAILLLPLVSLWFVPGFSFVHKCKQSVTLAVVFLGAILVTMPALLMRPIDVFADIQAQWGYYATKSSASGYLANMLSVNEVGVFISILIGIGFLALLVDRTLRPLSAGIIAFLGVLGLALFRSDYQPFRNMLPIVCLFLPLAGVGCRQLLSYAKKFKVTPLVACAIFILIALETSSPLLEWRKRVLALEDSRVEMARWIRENVPKDSKVFIARESVFFDSLVPQAIEGSCEDADIRVVDYILLPASCSLASQESYEKLYEVGKRALPKFPDYWRTNNLKVVLWRKV